MSRPMTKVGLASAKVHAEELVKDGHGEGKVMLELIAEIERRTGVKVEPIVEPVGGYAHGLALIIRGYCPWCAGRLEHVTVHKKSGLTWSCGQGCNP